MLSFLKKISALLFTLLVIPAITFAQVNYDEFFSSEHAMAGLDDAVLSIARNDIGEIYITGGFKWYNGETKLNRVAKFNPENQSWEPLGDGIDFISRSIIEYNNEIFVGGTYNSRFRDKGYIFKYNKTLQIWEKNDNGIIGGSVQGFKVIEGSLYTFGDFLGEIAIYDSTEKVWDNLTYHNDSFRVQSIIKYEDKIIGGGYFRGLEDKNYGVAYADTGDEEFVPFGENIGTGVNALINYNDGLYAGGYFAELDSIGNTNQHYLVAKYDVESNDWVFYQEFAPDSGVFFQSANSFEVFNGELYVGGILGEINSIHYNGIAKLDTLTDSWVPVLNGRNDTPFVIDLQTNEDELIIAGIYSQFNPALRNIAVLDGQTLTSKGFVDEDLTFGIKTAAFSFAEYNGQLVASGYGSAENNDRDIVELDFNSRSFLNLGLNFLNADVLDIQIAGGTLYASGWYSSPHRYISYKQEDGSWNQLSEGLSSGPRALSSYKDQLLVLGSFEDSSGNRVNLMVYDKEEDKFIDMSTGAGSSPYNAIEIDNELYVVGYNFRDESSTQSAVARWNTINETWGPLGTPLEGFGYDLIEANDTLIVAGDQCITILSGACTNTSPVAYYDNSKNNWFPLGDNIEGTVEVLEYYNGLIYAGGQFKIIDHDIDHDWVNLAFYDPTVENWKPLGSGVDSRVWDMIVFKDRLYIGGEFETAGGKAASRITSFTDPTLVSNEVLQAHRSFQLHQNYPNPFNPSTNINFNLPEAGLVKLEVFDVLGRKIAELVNEQLNSGNHSFVFEAGNLASGIYVYRLEANNQMRTRKMMLIK